MEFLTAIAIFLSPYLVKAGEKVSEETVKTLFETRQDLAEKFKSLFHNEIITLNLNESSTADETKKLLEAEPEIREEIQKKVESNLDLLKELENALWQKGIELTINAKTIGQVINNPSAPINQTITFND
jgi:ribosomal protein L31E